MTTRALTSEVCDGRCFVPSPAPQLAACVLSSCCSGLSCALPHPPSQIFLCLNAKKSVSAAFAAYGISGSSTVLLLLWLDDPELLRLPEVNVPPPRSAILSFTLFPILLLLQMLQQLHLVRECPSSFPLSPCSRNPYANMNAIAKAFGLPDAADEAAVQAAVRSRVAVWDL
jgi:hypothetical protein